jgi:CDP-diacylglycerol--glycerol-3-phosphate 3-phosphatidyltransferase
MKEKFTWNIPNILSLSRIAVAPVMAFLIYSNSYLPFTILYVLSLVTDILDGYIARRFNMQTKTGARLDSLGDICNIILGVAGMLRFRYDSIAPYFTFFGIMVVLYLIIIVVAYIRFKRYSSLHLYSSKVTGYLQGIFFVVLFCFKFWPPLFYLMFVFSSLSYLEEIVILLTLKQEQIDVKGLYWLWRKK